MHRPIIRHGFILILLALVGALFMPAMQIPRLALSAHTIGLLSGILLIAIGAVWPQFNLGPRQTKTMYWTWLYSSYVNWLGVLIGAATGAGRVTPIAAAGMEGPAIAENIVAVMLVTVALTSLLAVGLSVWGLRGDAPTA